LLFSIVTIDLKLKLKSILHYRVCYIATHSGVNAHIIRLCDINVYKQIYYCNSAVNMIRGEEVKRKIMYIIILNDNNSLNWMGGLKSANIN
jgi:hypothetical protein